MTQANRDQHSLWLLPEPAALDRLASLIAEFAYSRASPVFAPHVTLLGELSGPVSASAAACKRAARLWPPVFARVSAIVATDDSFRSMFLSLRLDGGAEHLRRSISETLGTPVPPDFQPHVSLAYGWPPCPRKTGALQILAKEFAGYEFRLAAVAVVASARDIPIADWSICESIAFSPE